MRGQWWGLRRMKGLSWDGYEGGLQGRAFLASFGYGNL